MKRLALLLWGMGITVGMSGCGALNASVAVTPHRHHAKSTATHHITHQASPPGSAFVPSTTVQWLRLPLRTVFSQPTMIGGMAANDNGLVLQVESYTLNQNAVRGTDHVVPWNPKSQVLGIPSASSGISSTPTPVYQLLPGATSNSPPRLMNGKSSAAISWPTQISTYQSGQNPASTPFQFDNRVIGQSGQWIWVALKGPDRANWDFPSGVWGFRHWDRLVALNVATGQYRIFSLPRSYSETLTYPLWSQPPAFATAATHVYIGIGSWIGTFPANPLLAEKILYRGSPSSSLTTARIHRALTLINQNAWQSVDADAAFWNCYVMKDSSRQACPAGDAMPFSSALSQSPTYFNHGDVGFSLIWASLLPMPHEDAKQRTIAMQYLNQALKASLLYDWIGNPSSQAIRHQYPDGPPYALPGYYRKNGMYWAKT
ncbi:MAG: hypothetical protein C7B46_02460 [Sulfobacillus benefaciens]|uniref:Uncharacterized protein n=1 Tax=Sulfobacillus benefaciens TaxID=453960 RepID=A0A2T2XKL9_9FIRM|nr:MAG: hypothetical protein C7B46_02460 [Sulfobacillus benefaciens]